MAGGVEERPGTPPPCFHGGASFEAIGDGFDALERAAEVVGADVLDAWFPPADGVLDTLREYLPWILRTSPPADGAGLVRAIARARGVPAQCVLAGAGSSALIFLALPRWLRADSKVLLLDPCYGEYAHVLDNVVGCGADRFTLDRRAGYRVDPESLMARARGYDLVVLVNPNSPTGVHLDRAEFEPVLESLRGVARVWVDETYVEYAGAGQSVEAFAAQSDHVVVCKSMSKCYALSGVRVAYLCAAAPVLDTLRPWVPPWAVSLPAQIAAVRALSDPGYYATRYAETGALREALTRGLAAIGGLDVVPGIANFVLVHLDPRGPCAAEVVERCRVAGVFLRDASGMGTGLGAHALRVAVKDAATNERVLTTLRAALQV